jgi:poly(3-hydroxybutyrate) depolymerase
MASVPTVACHETVRIMRVLLPVSSLGYRGSGRRWVAALSLGIVCALRGPLSQATGTLQQHSFTDAFGTRDYQLYLPSGYHGQAIPLLLMLHGCTRTPEDFARGTRMNTLADRETFVVVYPRQGRWEQLNRRVKSSRSCKQVRQQTQRFSGVVGWWEQPPPSVHLVGVVAVDCESDVVQKD